MTAIARYTPSKRWVAKVDLVPLLMTFGYNLTEPWQEISKTQSYIPVDCCFGYGPHLDTSVGWIHKDGDVNIHKLVSPVALILSGANSSGLRTGAELEACDREKV